MTKITSNQRGSLHVVVIIIVIVALIAALGYVLWRNVKNNETDSNRKNDQAAQSQQANTPKKTTYTFDSAVADINQLLSKQGCDGQGAPAIDKANFKQVSDSAPFNYQGGISLIDDSLTYAYTQYGCGGGSGSVALLKRSNDGWKLVNEDARIYPMCDKVRGQGFPTSIVDKCYENDDSTDPVAI